MAPVLSWGNDGGRVATCGLWAVRCWSIGIVLFSGSLYWLRLGGPRWLGPVTPLGGVAPGVPPNGATGVSSLPVAGSTFGTANTTFNYTVAP